MFKIFDGFIAAVSTETKIPFLKDENGNYTANIEFSNDRRQKVFVTLDKDESGDGIVRYYSVICHLPEKQHSLELFRDALQAGVYFDYGAIGLMDSTLIVFQTVLLNNLQARTFIKSLVYVAAKADELEESLVHVDEA